MALRSIARRIRDLSEEITILDTPLSTPVQRVAPRTLALLGIGAVNAGRTLVAASENIDRLPSEAAFAHLRGVAPIPASSGKSKVTGSTPAATATPTAHCT